MTGNRQVKPFARMLRKNQTDTEQRLWKHLRNRHLVGYKFRRQCPIGPYICDFVCLEKHLVVEIDGGQHMEREQYDTGRTALLESRGFKLLRFWNDEVLRDTEAVLSAILRELENPSSKPFSQREKGFHPSPVARRADESST